MDYFKTINSEGYLESISTGGGQIPISEEEYNTIMSVIMSHTEVEGKGYRLRPDLTWVEYDLEVVEIGDEEIPAQEAMEIILGRSE